MRKKKPDILAEIRPITKLLCYIRGISKGGQVVYEGPETKNTYRFTYDKPCLVIGQELDERDVYGLMQKVKKELGSCGSCQGRGRKKEQTYQIFGLKDRE